MLSERIRAGDFPSAVYVVAEKGSVVLADALGDAVKEGEQHAATLDTIYDLASLTSPSSQALSVRAAWSRARLNLTMRWRVTCRSSTVKTNVPSRFVTC